MLVLLVNAMVANGLWRRRRGACRGLPRTHKRHMQEEQCRKDEVTSTIRTLPQCRSEEIQLLLTSAADGDDASIWKHGICHRYVSSIKFIEVKVNQIQSNHITSNASSINSRRSVNRRHNDRECRTSSVIGEWRETNRMRTPEENGEYGVKWKAGDEREEENRNKTLESQILSHIAWYFLCFAFSSANEGDEKRRERRDLSLLFFQSLIQVFVIPFLSSFLEHFVPRNKYDEINHVWYTM